MRSPLSPLAAMLAFGTIAVAAPAAAHPHVLVSVASEIVYADDGKVTAVKQSWAYDPAYSAMTKRGLDANGDGQFSDREFAVLAKAQADAFRDFGFFTTLTANGVKAEFDEARDVWIDQRGGALVFTFTLPLKAAAAADRGVKLDIYDPQFYALFSMTTEGDAVRLTGAPEGCAAVAKGPEPIDMTQPRSWSSLLYDAVDGSAEAGRNFINRSVVTCQ